MGAPPAQVRACATPEEAVRGAGIVLCATNASQHVFMQRWLEPGMHVSTIRGPELEPGVVLDADVAAVNDRVVHETVNVTSGVVLPKTATPSPASTSRTRRRWPSSSPARRQGASPRRKRRCSSICRASVCSSRRSAPRSTGKRARQARGHELPTEWFTEDVVP